MRVCDLQSGIGQLAQAFTQFHNRWAELQPQWQDNTRRAFEEEHLAELPNHMKMLMNAASRLADTLDKAARECDDPERQME
jgi:uncharacterized protein YukE